MSNENTTLEELKKKEKTLKIITTMLGTVLILLFLINLFLWSKMGFNASYIVPIALSPVWFLNYKNLKSLRKEIALKENQQQ